MNASQSFLEAIELYTPFVWDIDAFVSRWFKFAFTTREERSLRHLAVFWQSKHTKHQQDSGTLKIWECYVTPKSRNRVYTLLLTLLLLLSNNREKQSRKWELKDKDMEPNLWFKNYNHRIKGLHQSWVGSSWLPVGLATRKSSGTKTSMRLRERSNINFRETLINI